MQLRRVQSRVMSVECKYLYMDNKVKPLVELLIIVIYVGAQIVGGHRRMENGDLLCICGGIGSSFMADIKGDILLRYIHMMNSSINFKG